MHYDSEKDRYVFGSTGRTFYANGYIGAMALNSVVDIAGGYDQCIDIEDESKDEYSLDMKPEEAIELADYMISVWQRFRAENSPTPADGSKT
jgi:hypothetical protein